MKQADVKRIIEEILNDNGINVSNKITISEMDSIVYMTIIVEIEQQFDIVLPDSVLTSNVLENLDELSDLIVQLKCKWRKLHKIHNERGKRLC